MVAQINAKQTENQEQVIALPEFPQLEPIHVKQLMEEGFKAENMADWVKEGLKSVTKEEALKMGFKAWVNGKWESGSGIYFPFTPSFGQLRLDEPMCRKNGKPAKYLTPHKQKTQAYRRRGCRVVTEGIKDAKAGSWFGEIETGAIAGVNHYKKALDRKSNDVILFDADGWINPQVFLNLFNAGLWVNGKVQLLPEIPGYPKAGLCEYFKAGYTAADYKELIDNAMTPKELLMEWPLRWGKMLDKWISSAIKTALKLAAMHLDEIDRERLLHRIKTATKVSILKLRTLLQKDINIHLEEEDLKRLKPNQALKLIFKKYGDKLQLNELGNIVEYEGEEYDLDEAYMDFLMAENAYLSKYFIADAFKKVAKANSYHPIKDYLNKVSATAVPVDINTLSSRYFGTSDPTYDIFLKKTLIAAVARIYQPGCKVDTTLVLQGNQGLGKSSFFSVLGGEWFDDSMGDGRDKDDLLKLHQCWIQEWGEVERVFSKRQAGELKAFISSSKDKFREPYARSAKEHKRHSIIVATVNKAQFLVDSTGNRRYWIIPILAQKIDLELLKKERDGIWAAAVAAYKAGEKWWLTDAETKVSEENNQGFQIIDEWESAIANYTKTLHRTTVTEILVKCFEFEIGKMDRSSQMRVATILSTLGWKKIGMRELAGKRQQCWEKVPTNNGDKNQVSTLKVETEIEISQTTEITTDSQPLNQIHPNNLNKKDSTASKVDNSTQKRDNATEIKKIKLQKSSSPGIEVKTSPLDSGFEPSQHPACNDDSIPLTEVDKVCIAESLGAVAEINEKCVNELTDEIVQPKNNHRIEKTEVKEILQTEVDESWPAEDIAAIAVLLLSCEDVKEFERDFYPESTVESPFPRNILNQAAEMLPVAKYEEIKSWVIQIKNKNSTPPATTEAVKENPIDPTPETKVVKVEQQKEPSIAPKSVSKEPDWSTFPHLTSNDPRAAKNRVEKIALAIANLTISEGADALYSQFKFGEVEWAKENYLTNREIALLEQLNNCKQLNLFEDESGENPSDCRF